MSNFNFDLIEQINFEPLYSRIEVSSFNPPCSTSSTTKLVLGQCVREIKSSQQTSPCTNSLSNLSVTLRVLMSIWTSERKLHHRPSKQEMLSSSEGNLHFVCIKRWEYIWNHQKTTLGPITHNTQTHTHKHTLLHFLEIPLISCSAHQSEWTAVSGLRVDSSY